MKRLLDDTYEYDDDAFLRTLWYQVDEADDGLDKEFDDLAEFGLGFILPSDYRILCVNILGAVMESAEEEAAKGVSETQFIFYTNRTEGNVIGDTVRFTVSLRLKNSEVACRVHCSDFIFTTAYDQLTVMEGIIASHVRHGLGLEG